MDIIDICVIVATLVYVSSLVVSLGAECAESVWCRTVTEMEHLDLIEAKTVPFTYASEAILITVAATLKVLAFMPFNFFKSLMKPAWQRTPEMRMAALKRRLRDDMLLAVASMISGYPERASMVFTDHWMARLHTSYDLQEAQKATALKGDCAKV